MTLAGTLHLGSTAAVLYVALLVASAVPGLSAELPIPLEAEGWRHQEIPNVERTTKYELRRESDRTVLRAESECGASGRVISLLDVDLAHTPVLQWEWRIAKGLNIPNERTKPGDDFAARIIVMFQYDARQASLVERAEHAVAETLRGETLPGRSIAYVWSSRQPRGAAWRNPYRSPTILISRGAGTESVWRSESADVRADYEKHWEAEAPPLAGVAVLTDADNTCGSAVAEYADFRFVGAVDVESVPTQGRER